LASETGPPPIPRRGPPRATNRMTRSSRRSPPQEAARGFWIRAWGQREPAIQGTGRSNDPAQRSGPFEGGLDVPYPHAKTNSRHIEHPIRTLTYRTLVTCRLNRVLCLSCDNSLLNNDCLPVMHQPVDQGRCQGVVHFEGFAPFPEGSVRGDHDRSNFITGGDNLEQQIGPALVDGQIAQLIEEAYYGNAKRTLARQPTVLREQDKELNGS
jgi:hypothetical protein